MKKVKITSVDEISSFKELDRIVILSGQSVKAGSFVNLNKSLKNKGAYELAAFGGDLNTLTAPNEHIIYNAINAPKPIAGSMSIKVFKGVSLVRIIQKIYYDDGTIFIRAKIGDRDWQQWRELSSIL